MKFGYLVLAVLLTLSATQAAADTLTDLLPPGTKVVFGIRVHNLALSSVAQEFAAQARTAAVDWLKAVPLDGIDLLRDIDEILVATSGKGQNPPALIVVAGRFDVARLTEGAPRYHGIPLLTGDSESGTAVALFENGTALIGDAPLVRTAIDHRGGKGRIDPALNDRITSLRQRYDVWGLGEQPEGLASPIPEAKMLESVDRFQFGMQLASGLELTAEVHARSSAEGEKLNTALGMMAALLQGANQSANGSRFDLQSEGGTFKLTVSISDEELKKALSAETVTLSTVPAVAAAESVETGPGVTPETPAPEPSPAPAPTPAAAQPAPPAPKPVTPKTPDSETDTVVFKLPGKK
jgi:hypothetical protein